MTQLPGYNLYAIRKSELTHARLDFTPAVLWYPNERGGWYVASKGAITGSGGWLLLSGPHSDEPTALRHAVLMTDTSGT